MVYIHSLHGSKSIANIKMKLNIANGDILSILLQKLGLVKLYLLNFIALHRY
jgi:hypothetical protein